MPAVVGRVLRIIAVVAVLMGVLWIGQGSGWVHWPARSFMVDQRVWVTRGVWLIVVGIAVGLTGRRLSQR